MGMWSYESKRVVIAGCFSVEVAKQGIRMNVTPPSPTQTTMAKH